MSFIVKLSTAALNYARTKSKILFSPKYLLATNTAICVTCGGLGDIMQQFYEKLQKRQDKWDVKRTVHIQLTGFVIGPACHYWYLFLDRRYVGTTFRILCKKILLDQLIFSPINISLFFIYLGLLEGSPFKEVMRELIDKGKYIYVAEWIVWPPAQAINFYFLPTRFRVLYDSCVSLGFDYYYSYIKHRKEFKAELYKEFREMHKLTCANAPSRRKRLLNKENVDNQLTNSTTATSP